MIIQELLHIFLGRFLYSVCKLPFASVLPVDDLRHDVSLFSGKIFCLALKLQVVVSPNLSVSHPHGGKITCIAPTN